MVGVEVATSRPNVLTTTPLTGTEPPYVFQIYAANLQLLMQTNGKKFRTGTSVSVSGNIACRLRSMNEGNNTLLAALFPTLRK